VDGTIPEVGVTRREMIKKGAIFGGTLMWATPVVQSVGVSRALAQTPSDECIEQWASSWISYVPGNQKNDAAVPPARTNPNNALGSPGEPAENVGEEPFVSLGFGGTLTVRFAERAYRITGSEVVVVETTNSPYPLEVATVEVSPDGVAWEPVGSADNSPSTTTIDISGISFAYIQYVRLTDTTNAAIHNDTADGFDVNAVGIGCP
jgi:hypothetical protein